MINTPVVIFTLPTKVHMVKTMVFSVVMYRLWELDHKERWAPKWYFQTVVLENTLESPMECKEIKPVNPKETNPEYSLEGLMQKLQLQYSGHLMQRADSLEKDSDAEKDWRKEEKGATENEMVGWYH